MDMYMIHTIQNVVYEKVRELLSFTLVFVLQELSLLSLETC